MNAATEHMTRATDKPLRRVVRDAQGREYVAELRADTVSLRPLRSRRGGPADVVMGWGALYLRGLLRAQRAAADGLEHGLLT